jgi:thiol-disulfide isomerase/thioredoxin
VEGFWTLVVVTALAVAVGVFWRRREGRVRTVIAAPETTVPLAALGVDPMAAEVTLLQFSSAFCAPCRSTRRVLTEVTRLVPVVRHVEVDAESHLDAVRAFGVRSTPTTLLIGRDGRVVNRVVGEPELGDVITAVALHLAR